MRVSTCLTIPIKLSRTGKYIRVKCHSFILSISYPLTNPCSFLTLLFEEHISLFEVIFLLYLKAMIFERFSAIKQQGKKICFIIQLLLMYETFTIFFFSSTKYLVMHAVPQLTVHKNNYIYI